jgi:ubiquitin-conjugating enzyme E2 T
LICPNFQKSLTIMFVRTSSPTFHLRVSKRHLIPIVAFDFFRSTVMAIQGRARARLDQEFKRMARDPPHGIGIWPRDDEFAVLDAVIDGPEDSDYVGGEFRLQVTIPDDYPNVPPTVKFLTKIYHPNIDSSGRICLDSLKPHPHGTWKPSLNLAIVLTHIRLLMTEPNKDDPLDTQIAEELERQPQVYHQKAKKMTAEFAQLKCRDNGGQKPLDGDEDEL